MGDRRPPRATTASMWRRSSSLSPRALSMCANRNDCCSRIGRPGYGASSSSEYRMWFTQSVWSSVNNAHLVEVEPGLIARILNWPVGKDHPQGDGVHLVLCALDA